MNIVDEVGGLITQWTKLHGAALTLQDAKIEELRKAVDAMDEQIKEFERLDAALAETTSARMKAFEQQLKKFEQQIRDL